MWTIWCRHFVEGNQRSTCTSTMAKWHSRAKCVMLYSIRMLIESNKWASTVANDRLSVNCIWHCSNSTKSKDTWSATRVINYLIRCRFRYNHHLTVKMYLHTNERSHSRCQSSGDFSTSWNFTKDQTGDRGKQSVLFTLDKCSALFIWKRKPIVTLFRPHELKWNMTQNSVGAVS